MKKERTSLPKVPGHSAMALQFNSGPIHPTICENRGLRKPGELAPLFLLRIHLFALSSLIHLISQPHTISLQVHQQGQQWLSSV